MFDNIKNRLKFVEKQLTYKQGTCDIYFNAERSANRIRNLESDISALHKRLDDIMDYLNIEMHRPDCTPYLVIREED
jgi:hypothetical protein